jgi:hypothetical protein
MEKATYKKVAQQLVEINKKEPGSQGNNEPIRAMNKFT